MRWGWQLGSEPGWWRSGAAGPGVNGDSGCGCQETLVSVGNCYCCPQSPANLLLCFWEIPQCPLIKSSLIYASFSGFQFSATRVPCLEQYVTGWAQGCVSLANVACCTFIITTAGLGRRGPGLHSSEHTSVGSRSLCFSFSIHSGDALNQGKLFR